MVVRVLGTGSIAQALQGMNTTGQRVWINCAGVSHPDYMNQRNRNREREHLENIISQASSYDRLIHISTPAVLGNLSTDYSEEQDQSDNLTEYGEFKRSSELKLINTLQKKVLVVRLFSYTSARLKKQIIFDTVRKIQSKSYEFYLEENQKRSFVSEIDFRRMVEFTLTQSFDGIVNYTNSKHTYLCDVVRTIFSHYNVEKSPVFIKPEHHNNYKNLYSDQSTLFDRGFVCKHIGLDAVQHTLDGYENHNF